MWWLNLWLLALCVHLADSTVFTFKETATEESPFCCQIKVTGYGGEDSGYYPGKTNFIVNGKTYSPHDYPLVDEGVKVRGVHLMILTTGHKTCHVKSIRNYDTWNSGVAAKQLGKHLDEVTKGDLVVGISEDEASHHLAHGKQSLESNGIQLYYSNYNYGSPWYRSVFGFILRKGFLETARVIQLKRGDGPLRMTFDATCPALEPSLRSVSNDLDPVNTNPAVSGLSTKNGLVQVTHDSSLDTVTIKGTTDTSSGSSVSKAPPDLSQRTQMILYIAVPAITLILILILVVSIICFIRYQQRKKQSRSKNGAPQTSDSDSENESPTSIYLEPIIEKWIIDEEGYCEIHEYANHM